MLGLNTEVGALGKGHTPILCDGGRHINGWHHPGHRPGEEASNPAWRSGQASWRRWVIRAGSSL